MNEILFTSLGLLNLGWWFLGRLPGVLPRLVAFAGMNILIWALALHGWSPTTIPHCSFADLILLFVGLSVAVAQYPSRWRNGIVIAHVALTLVLFGVLLPPTFNLKALMPMPNGLLVTLGLLVLIAIWQVTGRITQPNVPGLGE
jgi:hypothetical protein